MTFNTQVVPSFCKHSKSAASFPFPRYKNGNTLLAGCEWISAPVGVVGSLLLDIPPDGNPSDLFDGDNNGLSQ